MSLLVLVLSGALAQAVAPAAPPARAVPAGYVPERVFDTRRGAFTDFEVMVAELSRADVVLVGEQHDDPNTHWLEAALLQGMQRRKAAPVHLKERYTEDAATRPVK